MYKICLECQENRTLDEFKSDDLICEDCMARYTKAKTLEIRVHETISSEDRMA